jgi:hypothetical protein
MAAGVSHVRRNAAIGELDTGAPDMEIFAF